jgi:predicted RNase H-like HicB family nuclease
MNEKILKRYRNLLPQQITVITRKTKLGFVAEIKEFSHCHTQGKTFFELIEMINDAVFTYLDIPERYRKNLGVYLPERIVNEIRRIELQKAFRDFINEPVPLKSTFSMVAPVFA